MRVMVIVKASKDSEAGLMPTTEELKTMGQFNEELVDAGVILAGEGLHPTSKGVRVRFSGKDATVTNGPFGLTDDMMAGFWLSKVGSLEEAVDWIKRSPMPKTEIEQRPLFEAEDFGAEFTPELRAQEERQRARAEQIGKGTQH